MEPEVALALSARGWSDEFRRFVADHGGARIRVTAIGSEDLRDESFDVLIIDDVCSFLTPRLVADVQEAGRAVVGVYDGTEFPEGRAALQRLGVSAVLDATADPDEFLALVTEVTAPSADGHGRHLGAPSEDGADPDSRGRVVVVSGPGGGCGVTEVAIALGDSLLRCERSVALVDADDLSPSVAQRLGLALHPNVRTAVDLWEQRSRSVVDALQARHGLPVLVGMPGVVEWRELRTFDVLGVIDELIDTFSHVVIDAGNRADPGRSLSSASIERADVVVAVCAPTPIGVTRLISWHSRLTTSDRDRFEVVVNRSPRDPFRRGELLDEIRSGIDPDALAFLPEDDSVGAAAWDGRLVGRSRFRDAVDRLVGTADRRAR